MQPKQNNDWVPPRFWTAPVDTNIFRMLKLKLEGVHAKVYESFQSRALLESSIPDLTLQRLDGEQVSLQAYRGEKHLVLEFGALT